MATKVNKGLEYDTKILCGISTAPMKYFANGTGSTAEGNAQTALVTENTTGGMARKEATVAYEADYKCTWEATWTASGAQVVREIAVLDTATSGGNMNLRHVYTADKNLATGESITCRARETKARAA